MPKLLVRWGLLTVSLVVASYVTSLFMKGFALLVDSAGDVLRLLVGVAALAFVNATLGKLLKLLTLPLNCLTLGLFSLVINAAMLLLVGSLHWGFVVDGFWPALVGSAVMSVINALLGSLVKDDADKD